MPFYIGDYLADTMHLTTLEHGAYVLLICSYWKNKGPLPDDDGCLSSIAKVSLSDWPATRSKVAKFFKIEGGVWIHKRIEIELKRAISAQVAKRQGAIKTNEKRWKSHSVSLSESHSASISTVQSQPQSDLSLERERNGHPTLKEVIATSQFIGLAQWKAEDWFNEMQGGGWLDYAHRPIVDWQAVLTRVKVKWEADGRPQSPPGRNYPAPRKRIPPTL